MAPSTAGTVVEPGTNGKSSHEISEDELTELCLNALVDMPVRPLPTLGEPYQPLDDNYFSSIIEYDMTDYDLEFLDAINQERHSFNLPAISELCFEFIMDRLEKLYFEMTLPWAKAYHKEQQERLETAEDDTFCVICGDRDCTNSNQILYCDGCNISVHQECYGVPSVPESAWYCRRCSAGVSTKTGCVLCPHADGAMKRTDGGAWAHVACGIWINEVIIGNPLFMEPIERIEDIPKTRWSLTCYLCKKKQGACVQCHHRSCFKPFHVTCAQKAGLVLKITPRGEETVKRAFCHLHTPSGERVNFKPEAANPPVIELDSDSASSTAVPPQDEDRPLRYDPQNPVVPIGIALVISSMIDENHRRLDMPHVYAWQVKPAVVEVARHWAALRAARKGAPLLRRLIVEPWTATASSSDKKDLDAQAHYLMLSRLRRDLERLRTVMTVVVNREKAKHRLLETTKSLVTIVMHAHGEIFNVALSRLRKADHGCVFHQPVPLELAPDYLDVIDHPMDYETIEKRIWTHYVHEEKAVGAKMFEQDVLQVFKNCMRYNAKDTEYYRLALSCLAHAEKKVFPAMWRMLATWDHPQLPSDTQPSSTDKETSKERSSSSFTSAYSGIPDGFLRRLGYNDTQEIVDLVIPDALRGGTDPSNEPKEPIWNNYTPSFVPSSRRTSAASVSGSRQHMALPYSPGTSGDATKVDTANHLKRTVPVNRTRTLMPVMRELRPGKASFLRAETVKLETTVKNDFDEAESPSGMDGVAILLSEGQGRAPRKRSYSQAHGDDDKVHEKRQTPRLLRDRKGLPETSPIGPPRTAKKKLEPSSASADAFLFGPMSSRLNRRRNDAISLPQTPTPAPAHRKKRETSERHERQPSSQRLQRQARNKTSEVKQTEQHQEPEAKAKATDMNQDTGHEGDESDHKGRSLSALQRKFSGYTFPKGLEEEAPVFAKLSGYPWYPAMLVHPHAVPKRVLRAREATVHKTLVLFLDASRSYGWVSPKNIMALVGDFEVDKKYLKTTGKQGQEIMEGYRYARNRLPGIASSDDEDDEETDTETTNSSTASVASDSVGDSSPGDVVAQPEDIQGIRHQSSTPTNSSMKIIRIAKNKKSAPIPRFGGVQDDRGHATDGRHPVSQRIAPGTIKRRSSPLQQNHGAGNRDHGKFGSPSQRILLSSQDTVTTTTTATTSDLSDPPNDSDSSGLERSSSIALGKAGGSRPLRRRRSTRTSSGTLGT